MSARILTEGADDDSQDENRERLSELERMMGEAGFWDRSDAGPLSAEHARLWRLLEDWAVGS